MYFLFALGFVSLFPYLALLEGPDSSEREAALVALADSAAVSDLEKALYRTNWRGREGVLEAIARKGPVSVPALVHIARTHLRVDARRLAVLGLGDIPDLAARDSLVLLLSGPDRDLAVEALGKQGDVAVTEAVVGLLADPVPDVRRRAIVALGKLSGDAAVPHAVPMLSDGHHSVRFASAGVLEGLGEVAGRELVARFSDLSPPGKYLALRTLGNIGYVPGMHLLKAVMHDPDWALRGAAARALGRLPGTRPFLTHVLQSEAHFWVRKQIGSALQEANPN
ncbi:MAG: HEAT repeat domain-containing protein [bacterium]|nr:HEAT repeat domain-containing protein [bacterium]